MAWRDLFRKKDGASVVETAAPPTPTPAPTPPILFGKLPAHRDFVRMGPARHGWFERWLEEGLEAVAARRGDPPAEPVRFRLAPAGEVLSGVFAPSRDAVGRDFPLAILRSWPSLAPEEPAASWHGDSAFCRRAAALIAQAPSLPAEALEGAVAKLGEDEPPGSTAPAAPPSAEGVVDPAPGDSDADGWTERLSRSPALAALEGVFGPRARGGPAHALMTVTAACDAVSRPQKNRLGLTLELPAPDGALVSFWLAFARRRLGQAATPVGAPVTPLAALVDSRRLVLALGTAAESSAALLAYLLGVLAGPRHWVGVSEDEGLRKQSIRDLPPEVSARLEGRAGQPARPPDRVRLNPLHMSCAAIAASATAIVIAGQGYDVGRPVVLWCDAERGFNGYSETCVERGLSADSPCCRRPFRRYGERREVRPGNLKDLQQTVRQLVLHHDGCVNSRSCFYSMHDQPRADGQCGLSAHFMIDADGTIYQTLDVSERALHAEQANPISIGVEICNRADASRNELDRLPGRLPHPPGPPGRDQRPFVPGLRISSRAIRLGHRPQPGAPARVPQPAAGHPGAGRPAPADRLARSARVQRDRRPFSRRPRAAQVGSGGLRLGPAARIDQRRVPAGAGPRLFPVPGERSPAGSTWPRGRPCSMPRNGRAGSIPWGRVACGTPACTCRPRPGPRCGRPPGAWCAPRGRAGRARARA